MRRSAAGAWAAAGVVFVLLLLVAACAARAPVEPAASDRVVVGREYRHDLLTHCGILETRFAGRFWVTSPELHDGSHNPPPGWDNPHQQGTLRLLSRTRAEFRDDAGHVVVFAVREGATGFLRMCA